MAPTSRARLSNPSFGLRLWPKYSCPAKDVCDRTFRTSSAVRNHIKRSGHAAPDGASQRGNLEETSGFVRQLLSNVWRPARGQEDHGTDLGGSISHAIAETSDNDWDAEGYKHNDGEHNEDELSECKYGEGDHEYSEKEHGEHDDEDEHGYEDYNAAGYEYEDYSMAGDECYNPVSNDDRDRVGGEEVEAKGSGLGLGDSSADYGHDTSMDNIPPEERDPDDEDGIDHPNDTYRNVADFNSADEWVNIIDDEDDPSEDGAINFDEEGVAGGGGLDEWLNGVGDGDTNYYGHDGTGGAAINVANNSSALDNSKDSDENYSGRKAHTLLSGLPCDANGNFLPENTPPAPRKEPRGPDDWFPYASREAFQLAELTFERSQMSAGNIDELLRIWSVDASERGAPFLNHKDLYLCIDATTVGDVPWQEFFCQYSGTVTDDSPTWMKKRYAVYYRDPLAVAKDVLANVSFAESMDYAPYLDYNSFGKRQYHDFMSGNWAWEQANTITEQIAGSHGAMLVSVILGSDKTTVSVGTGQNEYYPLYMSIGNIHNGARRAHQGGVVLIGFLAIPKSEKKYDNDDAFRHFKKKIFHQSLAHILRRLRPHMTEPIVVLCADGHYRRAIFSLGPYLADYPEQVLVTGVVQNWCGKCLSPRDDLDQPPEDIIFRCREHSEAVLSRYSAQEAWDLYGINSNITPFTAHFPRADIYALLAPDLLHQIIKGGFKDNLVTWIETYLKLAYGEARAKEVLSDIDRRIVLVPSFSGLRRFPQGRGFKQWTGDDSKALMKVILPALVGHLPDDMIKSMTAYLDFCYLVRRPSFDPGVLDEIDTAVARFHKHREIFRDAGVRLNGFSTPRLHAMVHYRHLIEQFGAPGGLCTSITESKHIKAVKEPYRRSNRFEALLQMLITNQRLDKLLAARVDFERRGMLAPKPGAAQTCNATAVAAASGDIQPGANDNADMPVRLDGRFDDADVSDADDLVLRPISGGHRDDDGDDGRPDSDITLAKTPAENYPLQVEALARYIGIPTFSDLVYNFLLKECFPEYTNYGARVWRQQVRNGEVDVGRISVFQSATAEYVYLSDRSGRSGFQSEIIYANPSWRGRKRFDCVFINTDPSQPGFRGMHVARVYMFFSFVYLGAVYPCALVRWFRLSYDDPDSLTGMWIVEPEYNVDGTPSLSVVHANSIHRSAHLIPVFGQGAVPAGLHFTQTLDSYNAYYVNKYADHHSHEVLYEECRDTASAQQ